MKTSRRQFLKSTAIVGAMAGSSEFSFLGGLPKVSAQEAKLDPKVVRLSPEIEPLVRFLEDTPREKLLEEIGYKVKKGLTYREVLAALLLAGVRNIQPRPVGFKFHAVLVVNSAHLASIASDDSDRWLPIFWALDHFKSSQAQDVREGNWTMGPVDEAAVPPSHQAVAAFKDAMDKWDVTAADAAVAGLARSATPREIFEIFCRYGARDFREIGHKAIYVANSWRTLDCIGWQHSEPVLRSLAYALLDYDGENPARRDALPDRPWKRNVELAKSIREGWQAGSGDAGATVEMLSTLRDANYDSACDKAVELLNRGVSPQSIWDAVFDGAGEQLMRQPGIVALHAVTSANALHYAFKTSENDESKKLLLLQNIAFLTLFRGEPRKKGVRIDELQPEPCKSGEPINEIFNDIGRDRARAARKIFAHLSSNPDPKPFVDAARRFVFLKGNDAHDYKYCSAVLEDYRNTSTPWQARYLASTAFQFDGANAPENSLVKRTRAALAE